MLVIQRAKKNDQIVALFEAYCASLAASIGMYEAKDQTLMYHSSLSQPYFNVLAAIGPASNFLEVTALLEQAKQLQLPFICLFNKQHVGLPAAMPEDVVKRGSISGLYYNLKHDLKVYDAHPASKLVDVTDQGLLYEWVDIFCKAHDQSHEGIERIMQYHLDKDSPINLHIVQVYGKTIACCMTIAQADKVLLLWDTVLPMYRRQGVGSMMLLERLARAKRQGATEAYAFGMHSSLETAKSVGFKAFMQMTLHRYDPPAKMED